MLGKPSTLTPKDRLEESILETPIQANSDQARFGKLSPGKTWTASPDQVLTRQALICLSTRFEYHTCWERETRFGHSHLFKSPTQVLTREAPEASHSNSRR